MNGLKAYLHGVRFSSLRRLILITLIGCLYSTFLSGIVGISSTWQVSASEYVVRSYRADAEMPNRQNEEEPFMIDDFYPLRYLLDDTVVFEEADIISPIMTNMAKRDIVYIIESDETYAKVITEDGLIGYVHSEFVTDALENIFDDVEETYYAAEDLELLAAPFASASSVASLDYNTEIYIVGKNDYQYWKAEYENLAVYVDKDLLMEEKYIPPAPAPTPAPVVEVSPTYTGSYSGAVLTRQAGVVMGPSGKETYYNLPMGGVISIMQGAGYNYQYWEREDGVKMYGDYVLAACAFSIRPRGTIVETSLGTAICADTGTFAYSNPYQVDIAVNW